MPGRDRGSGGGRSEEDRLRDLAARERAREEGKRPPPSLGPSTRAGRERAAEARAAAGPTEPVPVPPRRATPDSAFDFDFARPSTRAAGGSGPPEVAAETPRAQSATAHPSAVTATATEPEAVVSPAIEQPGESAARPSPGERSPEFAPLQSAADRRAIERAERAAARRRPREAKQPRQRKAASPAAVIAGALAAAAGGAGVVVDRVRSQPLWLAGAGLVIVLLAAVVALAGGGDEPAKETAAAEPKKAPSRYGTPTDTPLPPKTRVVAFTGAPQAKELGILGTMPFERAADRLDRQAVPYDRKSRPVLRAFDLIATIANADPGPGGKYRSRQSSQVIARYLRAARRHDAALILDVQPGTSNFVDEIKPLERWLKEPDVHLALDPEWRMRPGVRPGSEIGWVSAGEVTATLNRVARVVRANKLPPKLVLVHRFTDGMIKDLETVDVPKEVVGVISIDGVGTRTQKIHTYDRIAPTLPKPWLPGFKVFYEEDKAAGGILYGSQVMSLKPRPHVVLYE